MENQILELLKDMQKDLKDIKERVTSLEQGQDKTYELLVTVSERVEEPLDNINALEKRVWTVEKSVSSIQRKLLD